MSLAMNFADLEVELSRSSGQYTIDLKLTQPGGDAVTELMPAGPQAISVDMEALRALSYDDEAYADALAAAVFRNPLVRQSFARARTGAESFDTTLRVRLTIDPTATELHGIHWERLRDPETKALLFLGDRILFSRYLSSTDFRPVRLRPKADLRALVVIASPTGIEVVEVDGRPLPSIDRVRETSRARDALGAEIPITALQGPATLQAIGEELREGYDILYLVCHGELRDGQPHLYLEDESSLIADISGEELVGRLAELLQLPRLVVLASCESAGDGRMPTIADNGMLSGLGPILASAGVPAVVAMQGKVTIETAGRFMGAFFKELSRSGEIDRATAVGRGVIRERPDWWMPVLFMRLRSGRIYWYHRGFTSEAGGLQTWPSMLRHITNRKCTPILGTGLFDSLLGSREILAQHLAKEISFPLAPYATNSLAQVAQYLAVKQDRSFARDRVVQAFCEALWDRNPSVSSTGPRPDFRNLSTDDNIKQLATMSEVIWRGMKADASEPYRVLADLKLPLYLTANAGTLLDLALRDAGKQPEVMVAPWNDSVLEMESICDREPSYQPSPERPLIYHLFGRLEVPDTLVLTEDDYLDYLIGITRNRSRIPARVLRATNDASLLFLGFRLDAWDFRVLFRSILESEGKAIRNNFVHVAAQVDPEEGRFLNPDGAREFFKRYMGDARIDVYWGTVHDFARELFRLRASSARPPAEAPTMAGV